MTYALFFSNLAECDGVLLGAPCYFLGLTVSHQTADRLVQDSRPSDRESQEAGRKITKFLMNLHGGR